MATATVPYINAYGNITKALERIKKAQVPSRFSQDFLETTLSLSGGSARPLIPYLKRIGFLGPDGSPTELYRRFRNDTQSGSAAAEALRIGYSALYQVNEYLHDATESQVKGIVVQVTGSEPDSSMVGGILGSFKALKAFAKFDSEEVPLTTVDDGATVIREPSVDHEDHGTRLKLGYTINLNLPATSDIAVFDAIFKSLRANLL